MSFCRYCPSRVDAVGVMVPILIVKGAGLDVSHSDEVWSIVVKIKYQTPDSRISRL